LREAGFDPEVITFQGLPAAHLLTRHLENDTPLALVDGNREHCSIFLIIGRRLTHIRNWSIPPAADHPPEATLAEGIRHTMAALSSRTETPLAVKAVYLTARASEAYDVHRLAEDVATPVSIMAPVDASPVKLTGARPDERFEGVLALCLYAPQAETGLNFYRTAFPLKKMVQQNKAHFVRTAIFGSLLAGLFLAHVAMDIRHSRAQLTALDQTSRELLTATFPTTRNVVDPLQQMIVNLRESRNKASFLAGGDAGPLKIDLLNALSRALPARLDIRLSQLVAGEDQLQLSGTTNTFDAVNQTKSYLEKQALFQKLTIVSANMDPTTERVRFKLTADYLRP
jgi:hypothetical protein